MRTFNDFKFRCSALGKVISKSGKLTEYNKTYIKECFIGDVYKVQKDIQSKYFEKGIACEQDGLQMLNDVLYKGQYLPKNKVEFENEYIKGTPDAVYKGKVYDIKNAYDLFTFGKAHLSWDYEWQVKGYLYLTHQKEGAIFYTLSDMPDYLISQEEKSLFYRGNYLTFESPDFQEACIELRKKYIYNYMSVSERFKLFPVQLTDCDVQIIEASVLNARSEMNNLYKAFLNQILDNKKLMEL